MIQHVASSKQAEQKNLLSEFVEIVAAVSDSTMNLSIHLKSHLLEVSLQSVAHPGYTIQLNNLNRSGLEPLFYNGDNITFGK